MDCFESTDDARGYVTISCEVPTSVLEWMRANGVSGAKAIDYFGQLVDSDSDTLDFIDAEYARLFYKHGWDKEDGLSKISVTLTKSQYDCVTELSSLCGFDLSMMAGDIIGRTVSTVMHFNASPLYISHRYDFNQHGRSGAVHMETPSQGVSFGS